MHQNKEEFDNFEQGIRDIFSQFEVPPAPHNWDSIASKIAPKKKRYPALWMFFAFMVATSGTVLAIALLNPNFNSLNSITLSDFNRTQKANNEAPAVNIGNALDTDNIENGIAYLNDGKKESELNTDNIASLALNTEEGNAQNGNLNNANASFSLNEGKANNLLNNNTNKNGEEIPLDKEKKNKARKARRANKKAQSIAKSEANDAAIAKDAQVYADQRKELNILKKELKAINSQKASIKNNRKGKAPSIINKATITNEALSNAEVPTKEDKLSSSPESKSLEAITFLDDTTDYARISKISAIEERKLKAADSLSKALAETEKKLEEKLAKLSPYYVDVFVAPKLVYNSINLGNTGNEMATGLNAQPSFARRFGFEVGTKAVFLLSKRLEFTAGFNLNYMSQEVNYEHLVLSNSPSTPRVINSNTIGGFSGGPISTRQFRASSLSAGLLGGGSVYIDSDQRLRITFLAGYQLPLSYRASLSVNGEQTATWNSTRDARGVPSLSLGSGYRATLGQGMHLIVEPMATLYLGNLNKVSGPVNVRPYSVGLNTILRFRSF